MTKFSEYNILLKNIETKSQTFDFLLDDKYFEKIDSQEVRRGNVKCSVVVKKKANLYELAIDLDGTIQIPCDRCLDDMTQPISYQDILRVKFGEEFSEEGEILIVPESDGAINIAWFLYEFIVLNIPIKHVHQPGECNKAMVGKLKQYIAKEKNVDIDDDDEDDWEIMDEERSQKETSVDPRWDALQNIIENN